MELKFMELRSMENCRSNTIAEVEDCFPPYPRKDSAAKVGHPLYLRAGTNQELAIPRL
jgi:hypothetical protein